MNQFSESMAANKGTDTQVTPRRTRRIEELFPLWEHPSGRWAKKVRQKVYYFGKVGGEVEKQKALEKWLDQKDDILAGRTPRARTDGLLLGDPPHDPDSAVGLVNRFLSAKAQRLESGEISRRTFADYEATCRRLVDVFGWSRRVDDLAPEDFERLRANIAKKRGPVALGNEINRVRVVFNYAVKNALVATSIRYGSSFDKPASKVLRIEKQKRGPRIFEMAEIKRMLAKASPAVKAMILLGINAGLGQSDLAQLPQSAVDLKSGWLNYPRPKTGVERRCWLWPETCAALKVALAKRPMPADAADADLCFITKRGARWSRVTEKGTVICAVTGEFRKLLAALDINGHRGFYSFRRGFETIGGDSRDQVAVDHVMGHAPASSDMSAVYRQRIEDDRLKAVADHVRRWLFPRKRTAT